MKLEGVFKRHPGGRPPKISEEITEKIMVYIRSGAYVETACVACGVVKQTFYNWLKIANAARVKIEAGESVTRKERECVKFLDALEKAMAEAEMIDVMTIRKASAENWQAAAWRLERKFPDKWGRRDTVRNELSGPNGAPIETVNANTNVNSSLPLTEEDQKAYLDRHFRRSMEDREDEHAGSPAGAIDPKASDTA